MKARDVKIGATYYTRIGEEKCLVRVLGTAHSATGARFRVARLSTELRALPKPRTAATLHVRPELWEGFTSKQDTPIDATPISGYALRYDHAPRATERSISRNGWEDAPIMVTPKGTEVACETMTLDGSRYVVFRDADGHHFAQLAHMVISPKDSK